MWITFLDAITRVKTTVHKHKKVRQNACFAGLLFYRCNAEPILECTSTFSCA